MKTEDWVFCAIIGIICAVGGFIIGYNAGHWPGYHHGANQVEQYFEATGESPNEQWLQDFYGTKFPDIDEILDTLNPYGGK